MKKFLIISSFLLLGAFSSSANSQKDACVVYDCLCTYETAAGAPVQISVTAGDCATAKAAFYKAFCKVYECP